MLRPVPPELREHELTHYLTIMIEKLIEHIQKDRPDLKLNADQKKNLAKDVAKIMMKNGEFKREDVIEKNPQFVHKLTIAVTRLATLGKHQNWFENLKLLFTKKGVEKEEDLQKKLSPAELKKHQDEMKKIMDEVTKNLEELKLIEKNTPKLVPGAKAPPEQNEYEEGKINLFGILNVYQTGSIAVPVRVEMGNGNAFIDLNPNSETSYAQIDKINKISDSEFGDPLSLNFMAKENYESLGSEFFQNINTHYQNDMMLIPELKR